ncbi:MAG: hypothetical protein RKP73_11695 [Candidatus Contendobacter sp.]|nr:hypothetical protein [Candidatus Contendobacter sp.]
MKVFPRVLVFLMFFPVMPQLAAAPRIVTAAQVNGTWRTPTAEFKVLALGKQKLRVKFDGTYEYRVNGEWMANTGTGAGIAFIAGDTATFRPEGTEMDCAITMRFIAGQLIVTQEGGCGFGHNVTAIGTYRKVSDHRLTFSED